MTSRWLVSVTGLLLLAGSAGAQERANVELHSVFYGDNTEFLDNAYRDGETLLGVHNKLTLRLPLGGHADVWLGVFTDQRAGGSSAFQTVRPIISLGLGPANNRFTMGTLQAATLSDMTSPDLAGPHGLVPALEVETLSFTRAYENGLQWVTSGRLDQDVWISWQQLNTSEHRERFDVGLRSQFRLGGPLSLAVQGHIVHEGGQLYHNGVVKDNVAGGPGLVVESTKLGPFDRVRGEMYLFWSVNDPNRSASERMNGHGVYTRFSLESRGLCLSLVNWSSSQFVAWEGDPNYGAVLNDPVGITRADRQYGEYSLTKTFTVAKPVRLQVSGRLYKVDSGWDYAYRVLGVINLSHVLGKS